MERKYVKKSARAQQRHPNRMPQQMRLSRARGHESLSQRFPGDFIAFPARAEKFRFLATASVLDAAIGTVSLGGLLAMSKTSSNFSTIFGYMRLKRVEIFGVSSTVSDAFINVDFAWDTSSAIGMALPTRKVIATGESNAPAHLVQIPPIGTQASEWWEVSAGAFNPLFRLSMPAGSYVDVTIEYTLQDSTTTGVLNSAAGPASTAGFIYAGYLDGTLATGTGAGAQLLQPVGRLAAVFNF